jgi:hypothetical protein
MLDSFYRLLNRFWSNPKSSLRPVKPRRRVPLSLEVLEERAVPAVIGGYVYYDQNNNGIFDGSDAGIVNQAIELENSSGAVLATTTTNSSGQYSFSTNPQINTSPQTITQNLTFPTATTGNSQSETVKQFNPSLGTLTSVEILENGKLTSDIKVESTDDAPSTIQGNVSGTLTLEIPGENNLVAQVNGTPVTTNVSAFDGTIDFAGTSGHDFGPQTASGSASVTLEANQSSLTPFIGTGSISLTELAKSTSSASGPGNIVSNISSQAGANVTVIYQYTLDNALTPGNYKVVEVNVPHGYLPGQLTNNNVTPIPNSVGQNTIAVTLTNNNSTQNNFGNLLPASVAGYVYHDANDNGVMDSGEQGIAGVQIQLTGTNDLGKAVTATQTTGQNGSYDFTGLRPGTYSITKVNTPAGYIDGKDTIGSQGGTVGTNQFTQVVLNAGVQGINNNFGEFKSSSLSGYEYVDANNSGIMTANDPGIAKVRILLTGTDMNGNQVNLMTTTNASGFYQFANLLAGSYTITQVPPVGYQEGKLTIGSLGGMTAQDAFMVQVGLEQGGINYNFGHPAPPTPVNPTNPTPIPLDPNGPPTMSKYWLIF